MDAPPAPMLATAGPLPRRRGWGYELKWDGMRLLVVVADGEATMYSRSGRDYYATFPELASLGEVLDRDAILDGEAIALDDNNRPSFALITQRMKIRQAERAREQARTIPVTYMVFDILALDGNDLRDHSYRERRDILAGLNLSGPAWTTPPMIDDATTAQRAAGDIGAEGVVAKRLSSRYIPGRSRDWIKAKDTPTLDLVVGGYLTTATGRLSLLVGEPDTTGLTYRGRVSTGTQPDQPALLDLLHRHTSPHNPFTNAPPTPEATWTYPAIVVEVAHRHLTPAGRLRHPVYIRQRPDKTATEL